MTNDILQNNYNFGSATAWHNGHAFTSNHIYSVNDPGRLTLLTNSQRYTLVSSLQFDLSELAQAYVNLNPVQKMFYLKLIGFQNMDVLYNFISNMPNEYINEIYNHTQLMTFFDTTVQERTGIKDAFSNQLAILLRERQSQAVASAPAYTPSAPAYTPPQGIFPSYGRPSDYSQNGTLVDSLVSRMNVSQYDTGPVVRDTKPPASSYGLFGSDSSSQPYSSGLFGSTPSQASASGLFGSTPGVYQPSASSVYIPEPPRAPRRK